MTRSGSKVLWLVVSLCVFPVIAAGISLPVSDPTYVPNDDLLTWNWRILGLAGVIPEVPHLPTGKTEWIRMYSNGSPQPTPNAPGFTPLVRPVISPSQGSDEDIGPGAEWWYGLEYEKQGSKPPTVGRVLTAGEILTTIRQIEGDPNVVTPVFAFDQNQVGNQPIPTEELPDGWPTTGGGTPDEPVPLGRDKWLRARLILVPPSALVGGLDSLIGKTAAEINAIIDPLIPPPAPLLPPPVNNFLPGVDTSGVVTFYFRDMIFNDFPDLAHPGLPDWTFNWAHLPGLFDPSLFLSLPPDYFPEGADLPVDNNVGGALADWGGYLPGLNLKAYQDYAFFLSLETKFNNNGPPEAYIIGGLTEEYIIPEPVLGATLSIIAGFGLVLRRIRRRET